jgi:hypothetical protein
MKVYIHIFKKPLIEGRFVFHYKNENNYRTIISTNTYEKKVWNHITITYEYIKNNSLFKFYINGLLQGEEKLTENFVCSETLFIGKTNTTSIDSLGLLYRLIIDYKIYLPEDMVKNIFESKESILDRVSIRGYYSFQSDIKNEVKGIGYNGVVEEMSKTKIIKSNVPNESFEGFVAGYSNDIIKESYESKLFSDFEIKLIDKEEKKHTHRIHKYLFYLHGINIEEDEIVLKDINNEVLELVIKYMYGIEVIFLDQDWKDLMILSEKFQLMDLKNKCKEWIYYKIENENVLDIYSEIIDIKNIHNFNLEYDWKKDFEERIKNRLKNIMEILSTNQFFSVNLNIWKKILTSNFEFREYEMFEKLKKWNQYFNLGSDLFSLIRYNSILKKDTR